MNLTANDIITESYPPVTTEGMSTGYIPFGIKITHKNSGLVAICDKHRSMHLNRDEALASLTASVEEYNKGRQHERS